MAHSKNGHEPTAPVRKIIVVVEDDVNIGELIKDTLATETHYQASLVLDGAQAQALALLLQVKASLIILDIHLPGLSGYEVCDRIKTIPEAEDVPILFMSADETAGQAAKHGAQHFLTKPFNLDELISKVHELIGLYFSAPQIGQAQCWLRIGHRRYRPAEVSARGCWRCTAGRWRSAANSTSTICSSASSRLLAE